MAKKLTTDQFIEKSKTIHGDFYDYSKVVYKSAKEKVEIICPYHGSFWQTPDNNIHGAGCKYCSYKKNAETLTLTLEQIIESFIKTHGSTYDYSLVKYTGCKNKVKIICKHHGIFLQTPDAHTRGRGCAQCAIDNRADSFRCTNEYILQQFKRVHGYKYDYSITKITNYKKKVSIICKHHGIFLQSPSSHISGNGCKKCAIEFNANKKRLKIDQALEKLKKVHGDTYDYSKFDSYTNNSSKIEIICKKHGSFFQSYYSHVSGHGCPLCTSSRQCSMISNEWLDSLNIDIIKEYKLPENNRRKVDGYDPLTNTIYQFHGDFYHGNPDIYDLEKINAKNKKTFGELYNITLERDQELRDYGYNLIVMWESEWNRSLGKKIYKKY